MDRKKNSHFHGVSCTKNPANIPPPAAPKNATVIFRIFPGGKLIVRRAIALGTTNAPPMPVRALITHMAVKFFMNPVTSEKITHQIPAPSSIFL
jgi:hypothetical protein